MSLTTGQTLTFYEVLGPLGAGGMGEVYRARDTRLDREVAIKVLPEAMASDEERLRRFEREAKTLASLNHPNVAGIHGVDQVDDVWFLALELVPGEDLATRIARAPLPVDEAIDVCRQIAEGLEAAHEAGVVHRDLKPANVRVTPDGTVKLLDFGLAKPIQPKVTGEGTSTTESDSFLMTEEGVVLGTPTYMSPEQARGRPVDRRTDLWAFGCVLYECLTGKRAFAAQSFPDVLAKIVSAEPDWSALPPLPPRVDELLRRALTKDPRARLRDAGEARVQLQLAQSEPARAVGAAESSTGAPETSAARGRGPALAATGLLCLAGGLVLGMLLREEPAAVALTESATQPTPAVHVVLETLPTRMLGNDVAISPDGTRVASVVSGDLRVRRLSELTGKTLIESDPNGADWDEMPAGIAWSPDGRELAFTSDAGIFRIPAEGGPVISVVEDDDIQLRPRLLFWTEDLGLVYLSETGNQVLTASPTHGGSVPLVSASDLGAEHLDGLGIAPGGGILISAHRPDVSTPDALHLWRDGEAPEILRLPGWSFEQVVVAGDQLVLGRSSEGKHSLWRLPFDAAAGTVSGEPVLHVESGLLPSASAAGAMVYVRESGVTRQQAVWLDLEGGIEPFGRRFDGEFLLPRLSHDERAVFLSTPQSKQPAQAYDIERGLATTALSSGQSGGFLAGSLPDGRLVMASWVENQTLLHAPSGLGEGEVLCAGVVFDLDEAGERGLVLAVGGGGISDRPLELIDIVTGELTELVHCVVTNAGLPTLSPDGRYLLYPSKEPGRTEVFLAEAKAGGRRWQVTTEGAHMGMIDAAGEWIYCMRGGLKVGIPLEVWRVSVELEPEVRLGVPERLYSLEKDEVVIYDFHQGQQRFIGAQAVGEGDQQIVFDTSLR